MLCGVHDTRAGGRAPGWARTVYSLVRLTGFKGYRTLK